MHFLNPFVSFFIFASLCFFSERHTKQLFTKRKRNHEISFFLIDPNARVYCYFSTFFLFFVFYFCFISSFYFLFILKKNLFKYEFNFVTRVIFFAWFLFIWSFFRIDFDLSKSFLSQNSFLGFNKQIQDEGFIQNNWEFSVYFFQFFGLFYDTYFSVFILFCIFFFFFHSFLFIYLEKTCMAVFRRVLFTVSFYFFSGETSYYFRLSLGFLFFWFERFLIRHKYLWRIKRWLPLNQLPETSLFNCII